MKRLSTDEPLTADDVAERLDGAALRVLRIMLDVRQQGGDLMRDVKSSRYLTNNLEWLAAEIAAWGVDPREPAASDARATD